MKFKTTQKAVTAGYSSRISVGYADLQHLMHCTDPVAYTSGCYGWNADIYDVCGVAIVTGYRVFGNYTAPYGICRKYDQQAKELIKQHWVTTNDLADALEILQEKFVGEIMDLYSVSVIVDGRRTKLLNLCNKYGIDTTDIMDYYYAGGLEAHLTATLNKPVWGCAKK